MRRQINSVMNLNLQLIVHIGVYSRIDTNLYHIVVNLTNTYKQVMTYTSVLRDSTSCLWNVFMINYFISF